MSSPSPLLPVYRRLLASREPLPAHLVRRMLTDAPHAEDAIVPALLIARTDVTGADAAALLDALRTEKGRVPSPVAAGYLLRADVTEHAAMVAAAAITADDHALAAATHAPCRAAHVELLRSSWKGSPAVLVALAGNTAVDLATRLVAVTALDELPQPQDTDREAIRRLPADLRARAVPSATAGWLLADLTDAPLDTETAAAAARRLLRMPRPATEPAPEAAAVRRIAAYLPAAAAALLRAAVVEAVWLSAADAATTMLALTPDDGDLAARAGLLPWPVLLEAAADDAVWDAIGEQLTALLTDPETAAVLTTLTDTMTGTVADVLAAAAGVTAPAA